MSANLFGNDLFGQPLRPTDPGGPLHQRFLVPPFTVLSGRDGPWMERKRAWVSLGIRGDEGRRDGGGASWLGSFTGWMDDKAGGNRGTATGTSVFDPVLCEIVYRWFCPPGGHVLDPFAGESVKGIVATVLGYGYTGVELRQEQVDANVAQAARVGGIAPLWLCGDSASLDTVLPAGQQYDLVWTSPPYYDLEVYSDGAADGSAMPTYTEFMRWYAQVFEQAVRRLRKDRFLAVKVGEIRDKGNGAYRGFVPDNVRVFMDLGLSYYNEAILVTPVGSLPIRATHQFRRGRKMLKTHQNILVFYNGDVRRIKEHHADLLVVEGQEEGGDGAAAGG